MFHLNKMIQFLPLASLPWQPDSFLEPTFLLAYHPQSRGRLPVADDLHIVLAHRCQLWMHELHYFLGGFDDLLILIDMFLCQGFTEGRLPGLRVVFVFSKSK